MPGVDITDEAIEPVAARKPPGKSDSSNVLDKLRNLMLRMEGGREAEVGVSGDEVEASAEPFPAGAGARGTLVSIGAMVNRFVPDYQSKSTTGGNKHGRRGHPFMGAGVQDFWDRHPITDRISAVATQPVRRLVRGGPGACVLSAYSRGVRGGLDGAGAPARGVNAWISGAGQVLIGV